MVTGLAFTETAAQLRHAGRGTLSATGKVTLYFSPGSANERWEVTYVSVSTNQPSTATVVPIAEVALNSNDTTTMSAANSRGASWSGNSDSFNGLVHVGPCDNLSVLFYPGPGSTAGQVAQLAGVIAMVVLTGTRYTKRGLT